MIKFSIAAVIRRPGDPRFLAVRRPLDDDHLPGVWGLPAVTVAPGELPESAVRRLGREKLGVEILPTRYVGVDTADRGDYRLVLIDIEAELIGGEPDVHAATTAATKYVDARWTTDPGLLEEAAARGSLCSRILLRELAPSPDRPDHPRP